MKLRKKQEESLQIGVCKYIKKEYPNVIFFCDLSSGMKLSIGQAVKAQKMKSSRGLPDLFIACERKGFNGLFLELKREGVNVYLKDGKTMTSNKHINEQASILEALRLEGYVAEFAVGFDEVKSKIDNYLKTN